MSQEYDEDARFLGCKISIIRPIFKVLALILIVISIILVVFGLLPHDRVPLTDKQLPGGYLGCASTIEANKGDIVIMDYEIEEGTNVDFYLTYAESWRNGNHDYIEKNEHDESGHFEIDIEKSGTYFLNFENSNPSSSEQFPVSLSYKVMNRYSPAHVVFGVILFAVGLILTLICPKQKEAIPIWKEETVMG